MTSQPQVWPFEVDWKGGFQVNLAYKTDILTSESRKEQRRALRTTPRRRIEFSAVADGARLRTFRALMASRRGYDLIMPDASRRMAVVAATEDEMEVAGAADWLVEGARVVVIEGARRELRTVEAVDDSTITFTDTSDDWSTRAILYPALAGRLPDTLSVSQPTNAVAQVRVSFEVTPASEPPVDEGEPVATLSGREIFTRLPNWRGGLAADYNFPSSTVDYGRGVTAIFEPATFATQITKAAYVGQGAEDIAAIEQFFRRMRGRQGEFYMPSGLPDLVLVDEASSGETAILVEGAEVFEAYGDDTVHRAIEILMMDGTRIWRRLADENPITAGEYGTYLTLASGLPRDLTVSNVRRISWMPVCRFASDSLTIDYLTSEVAQVQLAIQTLEALSPE